MQSSGRREGYSSFFSSGFRARGRGFSFSSSLVDLEQPTPEAPTRSKTRTYPISTTNKIITKIKKASSDAMPFRVLKATRSRLCPQRQSSGDSRSDSSGASISRRSNDFPIIDPFSPSPNTHSIYIDLPVSSPTAHRVQSAFGQSSPTDRTFIPFPLKLDRRNTIHTSDSFHTPTISASSRFKRFSLKSTSSPWILPEDFEITKGDADLGDLDWRQFHVELLNNSE